MRAEKKIRSNKHKIIIIIENLTGFFQTATGFITAVGTFVAALLALWALIPNSINDCVASYEKLSPKEQERCDEKLAP